MRTRPIGDGGECAKEDYIEKAAAEKYRFDDCRPAGRGEAIALVCECWCTYDIWKAPRKQPRKLNEMINNRYKMG